MSDESDAYDSYESDSFGFVSDYEQYGNKEEKTSAAQVSVDKTIISDQMKSAVIAMDNERATIVQVPPMMDRGGAEEEAEWRQRIVARAVKMMREDRAAEKAGLEG
ncbi:hypothetical protein J8273_6712 [Carpediemonas membranifera]|uniref:Uncharacterized protein n=1 Tax=Carpediemonas membranifera TaxID=201153 RepID=A0A8J6AZ58_9EUKA|nr:hypothetical protein J8273_6712 [Carpediemonas membranifera]|eukprot:KAG9391983.1 hypothetical protein J8273_6712 [Carpediemonas membranifera]